MGELVNHHIEEIDGARGTIVVKTVVPGQPSETVRIRVDPAVEEGDDVIVERRLEKTRIRRARGQVETGQAVGQGHVVPVKGQDRPGEIDEDLQRTSRTQGTARGGAIEGLEGSLDDDVDVAIEDGTPKVGGELEGGETLITDGETRVAAHRSRGGWIVEAHTGGVHIIDGEGGSEGRDNQHGAKGRESDGFLEHGLRHHHSSRAGPREPSVTISSASS